MVKKIKPHSTGPGLEATFKNSVLDIPDQQEAYLISTGCGAGKTESIKFAKKEKIYENCFYVTVYEDVFSTPSQGLCE